LNSLDRATKNERLLHKEILDIEVAILDEIKTQTDVIRVQAETQRQLLLSQRTQTKLLLLAEARRVKQLELRNAVFDISRELQRLQLAGDNISRFILLTAMLDEVKKHEISPDSFEQLGDKSFAAATLDSLTVQFRQARESLSAADLDSLSAFSSSQQRVVAAPASIDELRQKIKECEDKLRATAGIQSESLSAHTQHRLRIIALISGFIGIVTFAVFSITYEQDSDGDGVLAVIAIAAILTAIWAESKGQRIREARSRLSSRMEVERQLDQARSELAKTELNLSRDREAVAQFFHSHPDLSESGGDQAD